MAGHVQDDLVVAMTGMEFPHSLYFPLFILVSCVCFICCQPKNQSSRCNTFAMCSPEAHEEELHVPSDVSRNTRRVVYSVS